MDYALFTTQHISDTIHNTRISELTTPTCIIVLLHNKIRFYATFNII